MAFSKESRRLKIRKRIRAKVHGTAQRPRLSVFRSNKDIYAQLINDDAGLTIASVSSRDAVIANEKVNKVEKAKLVGKLVAEKAQAQGVETITFDRGGYLYHGRIQSLADGAREAGLKF